MILSKDFHTINTSFDFYEGIISKIFWTENFTDLLISVYYNYDTPKGLKDKEVIIRFKKCCKLTFDYTNMLSSMKEFGIVTPHPEILEVALIMEGEYIKARISTNYETSMISLLCDEIWIETADSNN